MIIDAHHHLWAEVPEWAARQPKLAPLCRAFTMADLGPRLRDAGIARTILVEAEGGPTETEEFLRIAGSHPQVAGVVGRIQLDRPDVAMVLDGYRRHPHGHLLVGVRHQVQHEADSDYLDRPEVRRGLAAVAAAGLAFDLIVRCDQLDSAARAAQALPGLRFVLDHLGKPAIGDGAAGLARWRPAVARLAQRPNVFAKLSGLVTEADWRDWTLEDLRPFVAAAVAEFGSPRLMFGSDWPVCTLAASYDQVKDGLGEILGGADPDVFGRTAIAAYHLDLS